HFFFFFLYALVMEKEAIISKLHLKFAKKPWKDTFQLVRRFVVRHFNTSFPLFPLFVFITFIIYLVLTPSVYIMGFHSTGATCYLTADLFYLEVLLLPRGGVEEVKVAPHGQSPVNYFSLTLGLLSGYTHRCECFADFAVKLGGLFAHYSIPGDKYVEIKFKLLFYVPPTDSMKTSDSPVVQAAQVTVGSSAVTRQLQMASLIPQPPQLDPQGHPVFAPLSEVPNEMLPACFLLRLQPAIPVMLSFVRKLNQIIDVAVSDVDLQWAPLPKLLMGAALNANTHCETLDERQSIFPLPGGMMHSCVLPGAAWDVPAHRGIVVDGVAFTHPAHVSALVDVLRHQCAINTLLRSCFSVRCSGPGRRSFYTTESCMSIPMTMKTLYSKLEEITSAPLSPRRPATTEAENDHSASSSAAATDTNRGSDTFSQGSAVPEDGFSVSASACFAPSVATSELPPEISTSPPVSPRPLTPAGGVPSFDKQDLI
uniref:Mediator of RNA polymerase II transcription subunit 1 n=1 Tax=Acanthochromis polyacanthus TaxID=80966 RepID=A0A3Q1HQ32_9TELE